MSNTIIIYSLTYIPININGQLIKYSANVKNSGFIFDNCPNFYLYSGIAM